MMTRLRHDQGFTLVELLIGLTIASGLMLVVSASVVLGFRTTGESSDQVNEAAWGRILGSWFVVDVHAASEIASTALCIPPEDPADLLIRFSHPEDPNAEPPDPPDPDAEPVLTNHTEWWLAVGGEVLRSTCSTEEPPPDDPAEDYPLTVTRPIATDLESAAIDCLVPESCELTWVAPLSEAAPDRSVADRTYSITVGRRVQ